MMYERPPLEPDRTAVVVVDMINWMFRWRSNSTPVTTNPGYERRIEETVIPNHLRLIDGCRKAGGKVVYLRAGASAPDFRDAVAGMRELMRAAEAYEGSHGAALIDELSVEPGDIDLLKLGSGGFTSSALDTHLRHLGVRHVIYTGVATNACVLLTAMAGFDLGYHGYIVTDATAAKTPDAHAGALAVTGDHYALGVTTARMLDMLAGQSADEVRGAVR